MKKNLFFIMLAIISINIASAQTVFSSDFEVWQNNHPEGWSGVNTTINPSSIGQLAEAQSGLYSLNITKQYQTNLNYISSSCFNVEKNKIYEISLWIKGKGNMSIDIYFNQTETMNIFPIKPINNEVWKEHKIVFSTFVLLHDIACVELTLGFSNVLSTNGISIDNITVSEVKTYETLDINNIAATIFANGTLFNTPENYNSVFSSIEGPASLFQVPNQESSNSSTIFQGSIWLAGIDQSNNLHLSAETYSTEKFFWGPVANDYDNESYKEKYNRVWKIRKSEIQNHINNYYNPGYVIPQNILDWPANGDITNGESERIAPYCDVNENGIYDPQNGDYPAIRGDEALFFVFNDDRGGDLPNVEDKLKVEVRAMAYSYQDSLNESLYNNIFISYEIVNKSQNTYTNTYFGNFTDIDLGYGLDDYIGYDTTLNLIYGYNGKSTDGPSFSAFSGVPPVQGIMLLSHTASKSLFFENSSDQTIGEPTTPSDFYNYLQGKTKTGNPITYGENGINQSNPTTNHMFTGYPETGIGWNEKTLNNLFGDRKGVISYGPFTLIPNEKICFDIAYPFAKDNSATTPEGSLTLLRQRAAEIQAFYNTQNITCGFNDVSIKDILRDNNYKISLYPNPNTGTFSIQITEFIPKSKIEIYSILGKKLFEKEITTNNQTFNLNLNSGIYLYVIKTNNQILKQDKIIINK